MMVLLVLVVLLLQHLIAVRTATKALVWSGSMQTGCPKRPELQGASAQEVKLKGMTTKPKHGLCGTTTGRLQQ